VKQVQVEGKDIDGQKDIAFQEKLNFKTVDN